MQLTNKQERFALAYNETSNASEAYRRVYSSGGMAPTTIWREAHRLIKNPKVATRISEARVEIRRVHGMSVADLDRQLQDAYTLAAEKRDAKTMAKITMDMAKLHGLLVDRQHVVKESSHINILKAVNEHRSSKSSTP